MNKLSLGKIAPFFILSVVAIASIFIPSFPNFDNGKYNSADVAWILVATAFFLTQLKGLVIVVAYSFTVSFLIFKFINFILPIYISRKEELPGLNAGQHDEYYTLGTLLVQTDGGIKEVHTED